LARLSLAVLTQFIREEFEEIKRRPRKLPWVMGWRHEIELMSGDKRIPTDGGPSFGQTPFAELNSDGLPPGPKENPGGSEDRPTAESTAPRKNRGRVDIKRQTAGRGGKTVTVVTGFVGIGLPEKEQLAKAMQRACGTGGTVKDGQIEIQGDKREEVARILTEANFRPVFAGG
jgi:translation initiation factor 1